MLASGYQSEAYAQAMAYAGKPLALPRSGGWLVQRPIAGSNLVDAMGAYPLFSCVNWTELAEDLQGLRGVVSVTAVLDPFCPLAEADLHVAFGAMVRPFKQHFVTDLQQYAVLPPNHQRNLRRAQAHLHVVRETDPQTVLPLWQNLYANLVQRHAIAGLACFSTDSFAQQFCVPGLVVFSARLHGETVGQVLWMQQGEVAYYHLAAYSEAGYEARASFALFAASRDYFAAQGLRWLALGAGAGLDGTVEDGLTRFKRGWSTGTKTAWLCGHIVDKRAYDELVRQKGAENSRYFPAYRSGG